MKTKATTSHFHPAIAHTENPGENSTTLPNTFDEALRLFHEQAFTTKSDVERYLTHLGERAKSEGTPDAATLAMLEKVFRERAATLPEAESCAGTVGRSRIVAISNRVIDPDKSAAGGVAVALSEALRGEDGLWFGWSGKISESKPRALNKRTFGKTILAQVDLTAAEHRDYYSGYYNSVLWPVLQDCAKWVDFKPEYYDAYKSVNKTFAEHLAPMLRSDDVLWVNDCHLIPLAKELRELGCQQKIGFFNHSPFPSADTFKHIPQHRDLAQALMAYNLVGMQIPRDVDNFKHYLNSEVLGHRDTDTPARVQPRIEHFPIGIDVDSLRAIELDDASRAIIDDISRRTAGRIVMMGVERLDYAKGIPRKIKAFDDLLQRRPDLLGRVTLFQIAAPSRESVQAYRNLMDKTGRLVNEVNKRHGNENWTPVIYLNHSVDRKALPSLYAMSKVGVISSVADGMNLVAKEYVASQRVNDPGALILSEGAGASAQLVDAVRIPPKNRAALTEAYEKALDMPLAERKARHASMMSNIERHNLKNWYNGYFKSLREL